jgi:hypothetical protein
MTAMPAADAGIPQPTGSILPASRTVTCTFDEYEVQIALGQDGRFLGIVGVSVKKDFRSLRQRIDSRGSHDVLDIYEPER